MANVMRGGFVRDDATRALVVSGLPAGPTVRSSATGTTTSTSLVVAAPAGLTEGDTMLVLVAGRGSSSMTCTPPAGWVQELAQARSTSGMLFGYAKTADAADAAASTFTFTLSVANTHAAVILAIPGGAVVDDAVGASGAGSTTHTCPAPTTTVDNTLLVRVACSAVGTLPLSWVWEAPATEQNEALSVGTGAGGISVATEPQASLGLGVSRNATAAQSSTPATATIALRLP